MRRQEFDYIVVGAGTAGCIVAGRLREDARRTVLLIEAGGSDRSPLIRMPACVPFAYQNRRLGWGYRSGPESELGGRTIDEKRGRVIGGTSSINAMIANRGNRRDFDGWAAAGLAAWDYAHCLPYFRRMETFSGGADAWRGGAGPMRITRSAAAHPLYARFLRGGEQAGHPIAADHNGAEQEGLHIAQAFIGGGERWTTARGYLHEPGPTANLTIWRRSLVHRIAIDGGRARGAVVTRGGETVEAIATREIVLCAGAFNSPQLLMLSGVGDAAQLRALGIELRAHRPHVGRNLENHPGVNLQYATRREDSLVSELGPVGRVALAGDWMLRRRGLGTSNFFEAGAFLRTRGDVAFPDMQLEFLPLVRFVRDGRLRAGPGFQFWLDLSRPASRGHVRLRSADPAAAPVIVFNHLAAATDRSDLIAAIRLTRALVHQPAWEGIRGAELLPGADATTDTDLEHFIRSHLGTSYHPSGTCRMGADADSVVDPQARVREVDGLRVIDASIMPRIVTANLSATVMMMAEKLSDCLLGRPALAAAGAPAAAA